ncbi:MAG: hypothetical protein ACOX6J_07100, partial [Oscillospiraceae bacterium]
EETLRILYEGNVFIATTAANKHNTYHDDDRIFSFEEMITRADAETAKWVNYNYTDDDIREMRSYIMRQIEKHDAHPYVADYYKQRLASLPDK